MYGKIVAASVVSVVVAGCRHAAPAADANAPATEGRILVRGTLRGPSVSFDADRVIGPTINMTRHPDGTWGGWIRDRAVNLDVVPGQISGASLTLKVQDLAEGVEISGLWIGGAQLGDQIAMRVTPEELYVRDPFVRPPVYLEANGKGFYGTGVFGNVVELVGAAALPHPPEPQFALGLLGAF